MEPHRKSPYSNKNAKRALYIDDDPSMRTIIRKTVKSIDQSVAFEEAESALKGMVALGQGHDDGRFPDVIFLDINMPGADGHDFMNKYSRLYALAYPNTRVYMVTSSTDRADMEQTMRYPFVHGYLTKPVDPEELAKVFR